jgi:hypothetical protein
LLYPDRGMITISIMLANIMQGVDNTILNVILRVPVERDHGFRWKMITSSSGR